MLPSLPKNMCNQRFPQWEATELKELKEEVKGARLKYSPVCTAPQGQGYSCSIHHHPTPRTIFPVVVCCPHLRIELPHLTTTDPIFFHSRISRPVSFKNTSSRFAGRCR